MDNKKMFLCCFESLTQDTDTYIVEAKDKEDAAIVAINTYHEVKIGNKKNVWVTELKETDHIEVNIGAVIVDNEFYDLEN